jgi:predicted RNA binding protein YcfA (HicA-like mRNA interferase family)
VLPGHFKTLNPILSREGFEPVRFQQGGDKGSHIQFIVHDQDFSCHF